MSRRIAMLLVVLTVIVVGTVVGERTRLTSPQTRTRSSGLRPPPPTALEEAGVMPEVSPPAVRADERGAKPLKGHSFTKSRAAASPKPGRRPASRAVPKGDAAPPATPAPPAEPQETVASPDSPNGSSRVSGPAPEIPPAETAPEAEPAQPAPTTPDLRPPELLSEIREGYPPDGYLVVVVRETLTSRLRVEAAEGRAVLKVLVRADGTVGDVLVLVSSGYSALDRAAVDAARGWRFRPATRDGEPVDAWAVIPVRFVVP